MTYFSPRSVTKFGHGRHGWIEGAGRYPVWSLLDLPHGMVTVHDDGWTYVYQVSRKDRRAFKNWA